MNSKQRRKEKREYPFVVEVRGWCVPTSGPSEWCSKNINKGCKVNYTGNSTLFKFKDQKESVFFSLKWV